MAGDERIQIRRATEADLVAVTALHLEAFSAEDHVPVMLGPAYVRATYRWQLADHRTYLLVALDGGCVVGLVSVCDGPYTKPMFLACLPQFVWSLLRRPALAFNRRLWSRLLRRPGGQLPSGEGAGIAHLMNIAVAEDHRGRGVFAAMSQAALAESRERGARAIRTGVYRSNVASRRAFAKAGWVEVPELATADTLTFITRLDGPRDAGEPAGGG
jgi:ribosomal protein S18 acetylase RimI-like enzyme